MAFFQPVDQARYARLVLAGALGKLLLALPVLLPQMHQHSPLLRRDIMARFCKVAIQAVYQNAMRASDEVT
jgi:hypothetical protein